MIALVFFECVNLLINLCPALPLKEITGNPCIDLYCIHLKFMFLKRILHDLADVM